MKTKQFNFNRPVAYNDQAKRAFHLAARRQLQKVADYLQLEEGTYSIRMNAGGIAVSGEITLHAENVYVQVAQSCMGNGMGVLFRSCKGRQDYTGGTNNFTSLDSLNVPEALAAVIRRVMVPMFEVYAGFHNDTTTGRSC